MNTFLGIDVSRWIPRSRNPYPRGNAGEPIGEHVSAKGLHDDRQRILRLIWQVWTWKSAVALIGLSFAFAAIPKTANLAIVNWVLGTFLILACISVCTFQLMMGIEMSYLLWKRRWSRSHSEN
jgi:hypothetical protein